MELCAFGFCVPYRSEEEVVQLAVILQSYDVKQHLPVMYGCPEMVVQMDSQVSPNPIPVTSWSQRESSLTKREHLVKLKIM